MVVRCSVVLAWCHVRGEGVWGWSIGSVRGGEVMLDDCDKQLCLEPVRCSQSSAKHIVCMMVVCERPGGCHLIFAKDGCEDGGEEHDDDDSIGPNHGCSSQSRVSWHIVIYINPIMMHW